MWEDQAESREFSCKFNLLPCLLDVWMDSAGLTTPSSLVFIFQDFILIPFHFLFICSMSLYSLELCSKERDVSSVLCALV